MHKGPTPVTRAPGLFRKDSGGGRVSNKYEYLSLDIFSKNANGLAIQKI